MQNLSENEKLMRAGILLLVKNLIDNNKEYLESEKFTLKKLCDDFIEGGAKPYTLYEAYNKSPQNLANFISLQTQNVCARGNLTCEEMYQAFEVNPQHFHIFLKQIEETINIQKRIDLSSEPIINGNDLNTRSFTDHLNGYKKYALYADKYLTTSNEIGNIEKENVSEQILLQELNTQAFIHDDKVETQCKKAIANGLNLAYLKQALDNNYNRFIDYILPTIEKNGQINSGQEGKRHNTFFDFISDDSINMKEILAKHYEMEFGFNKSLANEIASEQLFNIYQKEPTNFHLIVSKNSRTMLKNNHITVDQMLDASLNRNHHISSLFSQSSLEFFANISNGDEISNINNRNLLFSTYKQHPENFDLFTSDNAKKMIENGLTLNQLCDAYHGSYSKDSNYTETEQSKIKEKFSLFISTESGKILKNGITGNQLFEAFYNDSESFTSFISKQTYELLEQKQTTPEDLINAFKENSKNYQSFVNTKIQDLRHHQKQDRMQNFSNTVLDICKSTNSYDEKILKIENTIKNELKRNSITDREDLIDQGAKAFARQFLDSANKAGIEGNELPLKEKFILLFDQIIEFIGLSSKLSCVNKNESIQYLSESFNSKSFAKKIKNEKENHNNKISTNHTTH